MKEFLKSRLGTVVLSGILLMVLFVTARVLAQKYQIDKQIKQLESRADQIKGENGQLSDLINYLSTPQFQEKQAREKLNLKKDGEIVVGLPVNQQDQETPPAVAQISNSKKWYYYFFKKDALD